MEINSFESLKVIRGFIVQFPAITRHIHQQQLWNMTIFGWLRNELRNLELMMENLRLMRPMCFKNILNIIAEMLREKKNKCREDTGHVKYTKL